MAIYSFNLKYPDGTEDVMDIDSSLVNASEAQSELFNLKKQGVKVSPILAETPEMPGMTEEVVAPMASMAKEAVKTMAPAAVGTIAGGLLAGPPGAIIGGALGQGVGSAISSGGNPWETAKGVVSGITPGGPVAKVLVPTLGTLGLGLAQQAMEKDSKQTPLSTLAETTVTGLTSPGVPGKVYGMLPEFVKKPIGEAVSAAGQAIGQGFRSAADWISEKIGKQVTEGEAEQVLKSMNITPSTTYSELDNLAIKEPSVLQRMKSFITGSSAAAKKDVEAVKQKLTSQAMIPNEMSIAGSTAELPLFKVNPEEELKANIAAKQSLENTSAMIEKNALNEYGQMSADAKKENIDQLKKIIYSKPKKIIYQPLNSARAIAEPEILANKANVDILMPEVTKLARRPEFNTVFNSLATSSPTTRKIYNLVNTIDKIKAKSNEVLDMIAQKQARLAEIPNELKPGMKNSALKKEEAKLTKEITALEAKINSGAIDKELEQELAINALMPTELENLKRELNKIRSKSFENAQSVDRIIPFVEKDIDFLANNPNASPNIRAWGKALQEQDAIYSKFMSENEKIRKTFRKYLSGQESAEKIADNIISLSNSANMLQPGTVPEKFVADAWRDKIANTLRTSYEGKIIDPDKVITTLKNSGIPDNILNPVEATLNTDFLRGIKNYSGDNIVKLVPDMIEGKSLVANEVFGSLDEPVQDGLIFNMIKRNFNKLPLKNVAPTANKPVFQPDIEGMSKMIAETSSKAPNLEKNQVWKNFQDAFSNRPESVIENMTKIDYTANKYKNAVNLGRLFQVMDTGSQDTFIQRLFGDSSKFTTNDLATLKGVMKDSNEPALQSLYNRFQDAIAADAAMKVVNGETDKLSSIMPKIEAFVDMEKIPIIKRNIQGLDKIKKIAEVIPEKFENQLTSISKNLTAFSRAISGAGIAAGAIGLTGYGPSMSATAAASLITLGLLGMKGINNLTSKTLATSLEEYGKMSAENLLKIVARNIGMEYAKTSKENKQGGSY